MKMKEEIKPRKIVFYAELRIRIRFSKKVGSGSCQKVKIENLSELFSLFFSLSFNNIIIKYSFINYIDFCTKIKYIRLNFIQSKLGRIRVVLPRIGSGSCFFFLTVGSGCESSPTGSATLVICKSGGNKGGLRGE